MSNNSSDTIRLNQIIDSGVNIYGSREKIRAELVKYAKKYFSISEESDISKASYLAYLIDMLSILTSNQIYYQSRLYNEFFLVSANMNESVQNLAKWIGFKIPKAECAKVEVLFTIPLRFSSSVVNFNLSKYFKVYGGGCTFTIKSDNNSTDSSTAASTVVIDQSKIDKSSQGRIINNSAITVCDYNGFYRPVYVGVNESTGSPEYCGFNLTFEQCEYEVQSFYIPEDLGQNQFYQKQITFEGQVADMTVYVCEPTIGQTLTIESSQADNFTDIQKFDASVPVTDSSGNSCNFTKWEECINGIYTIGSTSKQYDWLGYYNKGIISFGNGVLGKQPNPGSLVVCVLKLTKGADGNVVNNVISRGDPILWNSMNIGYSVINSNAAYGGRDILSTSELKHNAIVNLKSRKRLVTDDDYNNINSVVTDTTLSDCIPILKRSDIKVNDITLYFILNFFDSANNIVPTRNITYDLIDPEFNPNTGEMLLPKNSLYYSGPDKLRFLTIFNAVLNKNTRMATYYYTATKVTGVSTEIYNNSISNSLTKNAFIECNNTNFETDYTTIKNINNQYPLKVQFNLNHIANRIIDGYGTDTCHKFIDLDYEWSVDDMLPKYNSDGVLKKNYFEMVNFKGLMITKWKENNTYDETSESYYEDITVTNSGGYTTKKYNSISFIIPDYTTIPNGKQRYEFYILAHAPKRDKNGNILCIHDGEEIIGIDYSNNIEGERGSKARGEDLIVMEWQVLKKYYSDVIINQDLSSCMQSSITVDNYLCGIKQGINEVTGEEIKVYHVHEVPSIYEPYYKSVMSGSGDFELNVIQKLLENVNFSSNRMMTDFTNIKFADTYGSLTNLRYNKCDYEVESRYIHTPWWGKQQDYTQEKPDGVIFLPEDQYDEIKAKPEDPIAYYVINGKMDGDDKVPVTDYIGYIAVRIATISRSGDVIYSYTQIKPTLGMIIKVKDELDTEGYMQTCIWNGRNWVDVEKYTIPLSIKLKVEVDEDKVAVSDDSLKSQIIKTLSEYYNDSEKMGLQKTLDRSEINRVCRSIEGVEYVEVLDPEFDIKFDYDLVTNLVDGSGALTQKELLNFTPQYVGFRTITDTNGDYKSTTIDVEIIRK